MVYIERYGGYNLSTDTLKYNEENVKKRNDIFGREYIGNLLPINFRQFASIVNLLRRAHIDTKTDLIELSDKDIISLKQTGEYRQRFIFAMRDLAIAEKNYASQRE